MRKVSEIMGMAISIDIPGAKSEKVFNSAFDRLREIDSRFSTYINDSELSKYQRGEISEKDLSSEFKKIIKACKQAEKETDGYFSTYFSGKFDPTGYVKGWSIKEAGNVIEKQGFKTFCIGAGGDILARSNSDKAWNIGIEDPLNKDRLLNKVSAKNFAVATSGSYEKGDHIVNPKTKKPATKYIAVTVVGADIVKADVLATAVFAAESLDLVEREPGYEAKAILR